MSPHRYNVTQGSPAWYDARRGKVTASRMSDVLAITAPKSALHTIDPQSGALLEKLGNGKEAERKADKLRAQGATVELRVYEPGRSELIRDNYMLTLINERMTGATLEDYQSYDMQRGLALEPEAFNTYEFISGNEVELVGFTDHPIIPMSGSSTDRRIAGSKLIAQAKCPKHTTHMRTILGEPIAREYVVQMQWEMDCEEAEACEFISYCPDVEQSLQLFVQRIPRDETIIKELRAAVVQFQVELDHMQQKLEAISKGVPA